VYSKIIQDFQCKGCPLKDYFPVCTACDYKAEFECFDRKITGLFHRSLFSISPFWKEKEYDSRWREEYSTETAPKGKTIRVPLVYG